MTSPAEAAAAVTRDAQWQAVRTVDVYLTTFLGQITGELWLPTGIDLEQFTGDTGQPFGFAAMLRSAAQ